MTVDKVLKQVNYEFELLKPEEGLRSSKRLVREAYVKGAFDALEAVRERLDVPEEEE